MSRALLLCCSALSRHVRRAFEQHLEHRLSVVFGRLGQYLAGGSSSFLGVFCYQLGHMLWKMLRQAGLAHALHSSVTNLEFRSAYAPSRQFVQAPVSLQYLSRHRLKNLDS